MIQSSLYYPYYDFFFKLFAPRQLRARWSILDNQSRQNMLQHILCTCANQPLFLSVLQVSLTSLRYFIRTGKHKVPHTLGSLAYNVVVSIL